VNLLKTRFPGRARVNREIQTYFVYRPAHAEHVAAMGLAHSILPADAPILDLGAGAGHMAAHLLARGIPVCGVDRDFFLLLVASHSVAPGASFVCCDLEEGLPFADESLGGVISVNTVHFLRNKALLAASLERVLRDGAPVLICALRHSADPGAFRNFSLPPQGYARVFQAFEPRFYATDTVVDCYRRGHAPGDADTRDPEKLVTAPFIEMSGQKGFRPPLVERAFSGWPHASGDLGINPLYQPAPGVQTGDKVSFDLTLPSEAYARDSRHLLDSMCPHVVIPEAVIEAIRSGKRIPAMAPLIESLALIDLPAGYGPVDLPDPA
jgi:SAM-dependent methyltransferase